MSFVNVKKKNLDQEVLEVCCVPLCTIICHYFDILRTSDDGVTRRVQTDQHHRHVQTSKKPLTALE